MIPLPAILEVGAKILDRVMPNPEAAAAAKQQLAQLEQSGELQKMADETSRLKLDAEDRDSARKMQATTRSRMPAFLSVITVIGFFGLLGGTAAGILQLSGSDVLMLLLGVLARETASVYNFWFGSSNSSQQKDILKGKP